MKQLKAGTILLLIYCLLCLIVVLCMFLYTAFYTTQFGDVCFKIGASLTFITALNPMGLIGAGVNIATFLAYDLKKSKRVVIWVTVSPILTVLCWWGAIASFVYHSGGV